MIKTILKTGLLVLLINNLLNAQVNSFCLFDDLIFKEKRIEKTTPFQSSANFRAGDPLCLRTVIHVLGSNTQNNLSDSLILDLLNQSNFLLKAQGIDTALIHPDFRPLVSDAEIQLRLAQFDPEGNPTNGITRTEISIDYFPFQFQQDSLSIEAVKQDSLGGKSAWNTEKYLNIWIAPMVDSISRTNYGVPNNNYFPFGTIGTFSEGIPGAVIDRDIILDPASLLDFAPAPNVLCHEVGHALGLFHVWGDPMSCEINDYINDTPAATITGGNICSELFNTCIDSISDKNDNVSNIMGYGCMLMFTPNQIEAMKNNILEYSPEIIFENEMCGQFSTASNSILESEKESTPKVYPNPNNGIFTIKYSEQETTDITIDFFDPLGKLIKSESFLNTKSIHKEFNLSSNDNGILIMVITSKDQVHSKAIMLHK